VIVQESPDAQTSVGWSPVDAEGAAAHREDDMDRNEVYEALLDLRMGGTAAGWQSGRLTVAMVIQRLDDRLAHTRDFGLERDEDWGRRARALRDRLMLDESMRKETEGFEEIDQ
jgi:hypothetical protein